MTWSLLLNALPERTLCASFRFHWCLVSIALQHFFFRLYLVPFAVSILRIITVRLVLTKVHTGLTIALVLIADVPTGVVLGLLAGDGACSTLCLLLGREYYLFDVQLLFAFQFLAEADVLSFLLLAEVLQLILFLDILYLTLYMSVVFAFEFAGHVLELFHPCGDFRV